MSTFLDAVGTLVSDAATTVAGLGFAQPRGARPRMLGRCAIAGGGLAALILLAGGLLPSGPVTRAAAWLGYGLLTVALVLGFVWVAAPHAKTAGRAQKRNHAGPGVGGA
jgi:hypothetical protein